MLLAVKRGERGLPLLRGFTQLSDVMNERHSPSRRPLMNDNEPERDKLPKQPHNPVMMVMMTMVVMMSMRTPLVFNALAAQQNKQVPAGLLCLEEVLSPIRELNLIWWARTATQSPKPPVNAQLMKATDKTGQSSTSVGFERLSIIRTRMKSRANQRPKHFSSYENVVIDFGVCDECPRVIGQIRKRPTQTATEAAPSGNSRTTGAIRPLPHYVSLDKADTLLFVADLDGTDDEWSATRRPRRLLLAQDAQSNNWSQ